MVLSNSAASWRSFSYSRRKNSKHRLEVSRLPSAQTRHSAGLVSESPLPPAGITTAGGLFYAMNIFVLDQDPQRAARDQCDKHVIKMVLETAQLLCSPFEPGIAPYRRTHYNHPCAVWAREARENYLWLLEHGHALADEYRIRYGKDHKSQEVLRWAHQQLLALPFQQQCLTPFAQAMPDEYKNPDPVVAYRAYYRGAKSHIATWKSPSKPPAWWLPETSNGLSDSQSDHPSLP